MKHLIIALFVCFAVFMTSCSKSVTTSSSKPERIASPTPGPAHTSLPVPGDMTPPPDFVAYEKAPQIIKSVAPVYPEEARKAGLEGTVWIKIWVGKAGKPVKVVIQKSASDIFDEAAIAAAKQFVFTPAILKGVPTDVWVSIPFYFRLK